MKIEDLASGAARGGLPRIETSLRLPWIPPSDIRGLWAVAGGCWRARKGAFQVAGEVFWMLEGVFRWSMAMDTFNSCKPLILFSFFDLSGGILG
jgi:hypothetical protein